MAHKPTRLGAAFAAGELSSATRLVTDIERSDNLAAWKLETTIADLGRAIDRMMDFDRRAAFQALLQRLQALL